MFSCGVRHLSILCVVSSCLVSPNLISAGDSDGSRPRKDHESFHYTISLWGLPAGTGTLQANYELTAQRGPQLRLKSTAHSNDFISLFFPVHNVVKSSIHPDTFLPRHVMFQRREGNDYEDFDMTFHHEQKVVSIIKNSQASTMSISPHTHGPLSFLYYVRTLQDLTPGRSIALHVHHDKKNYDIAINVEEIERMSGPWGEAEVIRCEAVMPFRGIFANEGNFHFWLTNDQDRIPVMMQAKVIVGSVKAVLEDRIP
ncbi:MAG: DUF3108 domain-containing protein [Nitrospirales bacterium]|nr:DUF3108 domain-containing protein [Nitrospira sp.]MDR4500475.1 DUF3108 domain-containing protein [Nitrospirales bacterium]